MLEENLSLLKFCRTCFTSNEDLKTIFEICNCHNIVIAEMLTECCSIQIKYDNSSFICQKCLTLLHISYDFRKKCLDSQKLLESSDFLRIHSILADKNNQFNKEEINNEDLLDIKLFNETIVDNDSIDIHENKIDFDKTLEVKLFDGNHLENNRTKKNKKSNHKRAGSYKCSKCSKKFEQNGSLAHHMLVCHLNEKPELTCPECPNTFISKSKLKRHVLIAHEQNVLLSCEHCKRNFTRKYTLKLHKEACNKKIERKKQKTSKIRTKYNCNICDQYFYTQEALDQHIALHSDPDLVKFPCGQCNMIFVGQSGLKRHRIIAHGEKPRPELCSLCGKSFISSYNLREHMNSHLNERPYKCNICGKGFTYQSCFSLHKRIHTNTKKFKCEWCERSFVQKQQLEAHSRQHTGEKPFVCDLCGRTFSQKTNRDAHRRTHTGEKPYACNMCEETFYDAGRLSKHKKKAHHMQKKNPI